MKIKAKLKALLLARGGFSPRIIVTSPSTTDITMSSDRYPNASKSMVDLTGKGNKDTEQEVPRLRAARSTWDVGRKVELRRRPPSEPTCSTTDLRPEIPPRPVTLPHPLSDIRPAKPKRAPTIQWAKELGTEDDDDIVCNGQASQPSPSSIDSLRLPSSSMTTPSLLSVPHPGNHMHVTGSESDVFGSEYSISQAHSMMSLSRPYRVSTTSDDEPRRLRKKTSSALHALKNLSRSTPAMSPSASPRHSDSEGPPRVSKGTKKFMRHFTDAPPNERVLNYFSCALVSDILLQGTLYITCNYFAFYSKIFGHVSRLLIPVGQVAGVQKERTAKIIPNAVGLQMLDGKSYVFGSLLSRDSTYKLMNHIWKKAQMIGDSDSEPPSAVQVAVEDDGEDSVSGSADSLNEEDQADSGYIASTSPIASLPGVTAIASKASWLPDGSCTTIEAGTTTNSTSNTTTVPNNTSTTTSSAATSNIPLNNINTGSPNSTTVVLRRASLTTSKTGTLGEEPGGGGTTGEGGGLFGWFTEGSLIKTCFKVGSIPVKLVGEGVKELWSLPRTSLLLLISTFLLLLLFASAAFMLHRVDVLSQQLGLEKYDEYDGIYEEVLQMQQRLHAAASTEIEKTLSIQLKHIATVRQSLEALVVLFNKEPPLSTAQIPDNT